MDHRSPDGLKIDAGFGWNVTDPNESYLSLAREVFTPAAESFEPDLIFWYFGFDTHAGDYGSVGLTGEAFFGLSRYMMEEAEKHCDGKLAVILAGGSRSDLASALIPPIITILAED
jgi:acetoin utilization deacetylase AcuC-like enzyme